MKKVAILTDSGCDIDEKTARELGIYVLRMPIMIGSKEYTEGIDLDLEGLKEELAKGQMAKTAQASPGSLIKIYNKLLEEYDEILHIPLSSGLSGMYQTSLMQAKTFGNRIAVVDAKCVCYPLTKLCLDAKKLLETGKSAFEVRDIIENSGNILEAIIIPRDITYLKNGGRISSAAAALANLLKIVPVLSVSEGKIDVYDKVRTEKRALKVGFDAITKVDNYEDYYWMIIEDECDDLRDEMKKKLEEKTYQEVELHDFGAVILSHTGPGVFGFGHVKKLKA